MIDFKNKTFIKLSDIGVEKGNKITTGIRLSNEQCLAAFRSIRDYVVFTDRRIISINTQGVSGQKKDYTSMPYSKINVYSIETSGTMDFDSELELYFSGVEKIKFEFSTSTDIRFLGRVISAHLFGDEEEKRLILEYISSQNEKKSIFKYISSSDESDIEAGSQKVQEGPPKIQKAGPNEWKCPSCGKVNQNYVGTCGCGTTRP